MRHPGRANRMVPSQRITHGQRAAVGRRKRRSPCLAQLVQYLRMVRAAQPIAKRHERGGRSEEHTSELQSLMRISYAVFCLKKKNTKTSHVIDSDTRNPETT